MAEVDDQPGPGWWLSPEGRWYPPKGPPDPQKVRAVTRAVIAVVALVLLAFLALVFANWVFSDWISGMS